MSFPLAVVAYGVSEVSRKSAASVSVDVHSVGVFCRWCSSLFVSWFEPVCALVLVVCPLCRFVIVSSFVSIIFVSSVGYSPLPIEFYGAECPVVMFVDPSALSSGRGKVVSNFILSARLSPRLNSSSPDVSLYPQRMK